MDLTHSFLQRDPQKCSLVFKRKNLVKFNYRSSLFPHDFFDVQQMGETPTFHLEKGGLKQRALSCRNAEDSGVEGLQSNLEKHLHFQDDSEKENKSQNVLKIRKIPRSTISKYATEQSQQAYFKNGPLKATALPSIKRSQSVHTQKLLKPIQQRNSARATYVTVQSIVGKAKPRTEVHSRQESQNYHSQNLIFRDQSSYSINSVNSIEKSFETGTRNSHKGTILQALNQSQMQNIDYYKEIYERKNAESLHNKEQKRNLFQQMKRRINDSNLGKFFQ